MNKAQAQLLDTPNPQVFRVLALDEDISLFFYILPDNNLHERGLPRTVLSAKGMHLSTCHLKVQLL